MTEHKKEWLLVAVITLLYSCLAFWNLGDRQAPQTFWQVPENTVLQIDLGREYDLSRMNVYTGISHATYEFYLAEEGADSWNLVTSLEEPYCFQWHQADTALSGRYLLIRVRRGQGSIGELALFDGLDNPVQIPSQQEWEELCDEQNIAIYEPTYRNGTYFDEIYHARTAYEFLHQLSPYETTHPPLGKVLIGIGIALFGMTPFGWRFTGTLFGCLMLPLFYLLCKRLFPKGKTALLGCGLFSVEFMHFTQTRIATIDTYALFFILLMTLFMTEYLQTKRYGALGWCGIAFGLGAASKWTCLYAGAGLAILFFADLWMSRKETGWKQTALKRCGFCMIFFVLIPVCIYALSYIPWTNCEGQSWQTVWNNQFDMFHYHSTLQAEHGYSSPWYEWPVMVKPMVFYREETMGGGISTIATFGNPLIWWGGLLALVTTAVLGVWQKDKRAGIIVCSYLAQLVPWMLVTRIVFIYHYFNCTPFLILSILLLFDRLSKGKGWVGGAFMAVAFALFLLFYPVLSGFCVPIEYAEQWLTWFPQWYFV